MITIPAEAVKVLKIAGLERMKVYLDKENRRVIFELVKG